MDWIHVAQGPLVGSCERGNEHLRSMICWEATDFSRRALLQGVCPVRSDNTEWNLHTAVHSISVTSTLTTSMISVTGTERRALGTYITRMKLSKYVEGIRSRNLWRWYINTNVSEHYPSSCFYLRRNVSEIGLCLRLQIKRTQLGPIDTSSSYLRTPAPKQHRVYKPSTSQTICES
jgi:hypothetical protein